jgi:hypothetical protein
MVTTVAPVVALPLRFAWYPINAEDLAGALQLRVDGTHVIAVIGVSAGRWHCTVNLHRGVEAVRWSYCANRVQGMRWAERWLRPQADRISAWIESHQAQRAPDHKPAMSRDDKRTERERRV